MALGSESRHLGNISVIKVNNEAKNFYLAFYLETFPFPALWAVGYTPDIASTAVKAGCTVNRRKGRSVISINQEV